VTAAALPTPGSGSLRLGLADAYTSTRRFVLRGLRQPDVIFGSVLMPVIFVVLFGYVFGSSISVPGGHYRTYLLSGLFAQSTLWASASVAVAVVAGATGRVGRHIVDVLEERGHDVVAISRSLGVDVITGEGLAEALEELRP
jgi:NAD dependent epimerase/dehydratase family